MKRKSLFTLLGLGLLSLTGIVFGATRTTGFAVAKAEPDTEDPVVDPADPADPVEEVFECKVIIQVLPHGKVTADKMEGHVGDIVTITADADIFYLIETADVNGSNIIQGEATNHVKEGVYKFALVEGENKVTVRFVVNQELLGELSVIYDQAANKDWTNLFSVENVLRIVSFLLSGGLLLTMVRYFIKDKALAARVEKAVTEVVKEYIPDATKEIVIALVKETIAPIFAEISLKFEEQGNALTVFSRCMALAQENTPEAKIAIVQELSSLKLSDQEAISKVKGTIEAFIANQTAKMEEILARMQNIENTNKQIVESAEPVVEETLAEEVTPVNPEVTPYE